MTTPIPTALLGTFQAMAEVVYTGDSYDAVYASLCSATVELVDGCDHASLMLRQHGRVPQNRPIPAGYARFVELSVPGLPYQINAWQVSHPTRRMSLPATDAFFCLHALQILFQLDPAVHNANRSNPCVFFRSNSCSLATSTAHGFVFLFIYVRVCGADSICSS